MHNFSQEVTARSCNNLYLITGLPSEKNPRLGSLERQSRRCMLFQKAKSFISSDPKKLRKQKSISCFPHFNWIVATKLVADLSGAEITYARVLQRAYKLPGFGVHYD